MPNLTDNYRQESARRIRAHQANAARYPAMRGDNGQWVGTHNHAPLTRDEIAEARAKLPDPMRSGCDYFEVPVFRLGRVGVVDPEADAFEALNPQPILRARFKLMRDQYGAGWRWDYVDRD